MWWNENLCRAGQYTPDTWIQWIPLIQWIPIVMTGYRNCMVSYSVTSADPLWLYHSTEASSGRALLVQYLATVVTVHTV